jgi:hypothetical protein
MMPMPMVAPLFLEDSTFTSTLTMVNSAARTVSVDLSLTDPGGREVVHKTLDMAGDTSQTLRIRDLLAAVDNITAIGSVLVTPDPGAGKDMLIAAQLSITANSSGFASYFEEEFTMPMSSMMPAMYQGSALNVKGSPIVALRSLAMQPQTVTVICHPERAATPSASSTVIQLAPGELRLVAACSNQVGGQELIAEQIDSDSGLDHGTVGISVTSTATAQDLAVYGFVTYHDQRGVFFSALDLTAPSTWNSSTTVFTGVPLGRTPAFPGTNFHSQVGVSNFASEPAEITVRVARTNGLPPNAEHTDPGVSSGDVARFWLAGKFGVPGKFCTSGCEANWYGRSLVCHEERSMQRNRS